MKAAIIVNLSKEKAISCAEKIVALMRRQGASIAMPIECKGHFRSSSITYYFSLMQLLAHCDAAITVGGEAVCNDLLGAEGAKQMGVTEPAE